MREFPNDLGGQPGFGPIVVEVDEPPFHEPWEGRMHAMAFAVLVATRCGTPRFRHSLERMDPDRYLAASYYERWLTGLATLLGEYGIAGPDELAGLPRSRPDTTPARPAPGEDVTTPRFDVGETVRVRADRPEGHTRCPGFVRGRRGVIARYDGACNFDDVEAHSAGKRLDPLYSVRFDATELWGDGAEAAAVYVDLFDSYLEAE